MTSQFPTPTKAHLPAARKTVVDHIAGSIIFLLGRIPLSARRSIGRTLADLFALLPLDDHELAEAQLRVFGGISHPKPVVRDMYRSLFQTAFETVNLAPLMRLPERHIVCPNRELVQEIVSSGEPCVALTAHTGNWELMAAYMVSLGVPLRTVARPARGAFSHALLRVLREKWGVKSLWRAGGVSLGIPRSLRDGETLAALIDQDTRVKGEFSSFFGTPAKTPSTLIRLGKKKGARFVTAFNVRREDGTFLIRIEEIPAKLSTEAMLDLYHVRLEALLREHPSQWVWFHKRWRSLESGERLSGKEYKEKLRKQVENQ